MATPKQLEEVAANLVAGLAGITWASRTLEKGEATTRRWADTGKIPVVRLADGTRLFDKATIERIAAERARKAEAPA